jgi:hypothetical protein
MIKKCLLVIFIFELFVSVCSADSAYKWTDEQGRVFFGSKPPKTASAITSIKARTYSRYKPSPELTKFKKNEGRARLGNIKETNLPLPPKDSFNIKADAPTSQTQLELSIDAPTIKVGAHEEIESCSVTVKNKTPIDVEGIQISFEFSDGTLIPANGPARLNIGQAALYAVDSEQLPIKLETGSSPTPKVIVNTDGETVVKPAATN